ncbi:3-oxo-5-alpha-steroid 4-dehydrogenase 1 isoform X2 [Pongo abelii]|uniref:3-oxo-5-alpha-steroid 4-dehydrogenase 1 isoform X2 n=1 Tax=Pongo abelii TaxID=9601 RepID=UPI0030041525
MATATGVAEERLLAALAYLQCAAGCAVFARNRQTNSVYGRHALPSHRLRVPARAAWVVQELPSLALPLYQYASESAPRLRSAPNCILLAMFLVHYGHREEKVHSSTAWNQCCTQHSFWYLSSLKTSTLPCNWCSLCPQCTLMTCTLNRGKSTFIRGLVSTVCLKLFAIRQSCLIFWGGGGMGSTIATIRILVRLCCLYILFHKYTRSCMSVSLWLKAISGQSIRCYPRPITHDPG